MFHGAQIGLVGFGHSHGRLGITFQEKLGPLFEQQLFAFANNLKDVIVSSLKPFSKFSLSFLPVGCTSRLLVANSRAVSVPHPPEVGSTSPIQHTIMLTRSCHSPPPV